MAKVENINPDIVGFQNEIEPIIKSTKTFELIDGNGVKEPLFVEGNERFWRADPSDGLRPLKSMRN